MTATVYGIRDWTRYFAKGDAVKYKFWKFVPIPTNLNSETFRVLMRTGPGREAFAVFIALVELAANLPRRGILADERGALKPSTIEVKTNIPEKIVVSSMKTLVEHGWLVAEGSEAFRHSFGEPSETSEESSTHLPPNPTQPNPITNPTLPKSLSPSLTQPQNGTANGVSHGAIGSGGAGSGWNPTSLARWFKSCGINATTADDLAREPERFDGVNLLVEWRRISDDKHRLNKPATFVRYLEKVGGISRGLGMEIDKQIRRQA